MWSLTALAKLCAALTIVIAVFIVTPVSDAAACAPEPVSAHQSLDHDPDAGDHSGTTGEYGLCSHGHCHHTASERFLATDFNLTALSFKSQHDRPLDDDRVSFTSDGLKRPPRG